MVGVFKAEPFWTTRPTKPRKGAKGRRRRRRRSFRREPAPMVHARHRTQDVVNSPRKGVCDPRLIPMIDRTEARTRLERRSLDLPQDFHASMNSTIAFSFSSTSSVVSTLSAHFGHDGFSYESFASSTNVWNISTR